MTLRPVALGAGMVATAVAPWLLPAEERVLRFIVAVVAAAAFGRVVDAALGRDLLPRRAPPGRPRAPEGRRLALGLLALGAGAGGLALLHATRWTAHSFALDHAAKVLVFALVVEGLGQAGCGAGRLAGFDVAPVVDRALFARSPAEFWSRYNRVVGDWLRRWVFLPAGGRRRPVRAVLLTFFVSGALHEYFFLIPTGEVRGWQLAFFMLQALGVLASPPLDRLARRAGPAGAVAAWAATFAFMAATSVHNSRASPRSGRRSTRRPRPWLDASGTYRKIRRGCSYDAHRLNPSCVNPTRDIPSREGKETSAYA